MDEKYIGFMAGYATAPGTWYLQRGGFIKDEQRKTGNLKIYREALEELHAYWPCIRTHVANDDLPALKIDINAGFKIIGVRYTDRVELEMIRFREVGNG
jgi:hypothetical protein